MHGKLPARLQYSPELHSTRIWIQDFYILSQYGNESGSRQTEYIQNKKKLFRPSSTVGLQYNQPSTFIKGFLRNVDPDPAFSESGTGGVRSTADMLSSK
jgi:hypothetical protein